MRRTPKTKSQSRGAAVGKLLRHLSAPNQATRVPKELLLVLANCAEDLGAGRPAVVAVTHLNKGGAVNQGVMERFVGRELEI
jgi:hypothetical protein